MIDYFGQSPRNDKATRRKDEAFGFRHCEKICKIFVAIYNPIFNQT
ncbi:hypothetical protein [Helicobacter rodentium]|nr:hypothetical protein [Helicobacter rodentium]